MLCLCQELENEEDLIILLNRGKWDMTIYEYLITIMVEEKEILLEHSPIELFEMEVEVISKNESIYFRFWDKNKSGTYKNFEYIMSEKQQEFFDLFVSRVFGIYNSLQRLVAN